MTHIPGQHPRSPARRLAYIAIEALEDRCVPTVTLPVPGTPGPVLVTGTAGADQFVLRLQPGTPANVEFSTNGGTTFNAAALADVTAVTVNGLSGGDTLTIDCGNGLVATAAGLPISFDGGPDANVLVVRGVVGGPVSETYTAGATTGTGTLQFAGATASATVTFPRLAEIRDSLTAGQFTIAANDQGNTLDVIDGVRVDGMAGVRVFALDRGDLNMAPDQGADDNFADTSNEGIVPISFTAKANVTLNAAGGNDVVFVSLNDTGTGLGRLTVQGGAGTDSLTIKEAVGVAVTPETLEQVDSGAVATNVQVLYTHRLGRSATPSEVAFWTTYLATNDFSRFVTAVERSDEAHAFAVRAWYQHYLGRDADAGGQAYWVGRLAAADNEESVMSSLLATPEYLARARSVAPAGTSDNVAFVAALYRDVLNRTASSAEVNFWVGFVPGNGRAGVARFFLESTEFRREQIDAYYVNLLHRTPDDGGLAFWVNSGFDLAEVRDAFEGSREFYNV